MYLQFVGRLGGYRSMTAALRQRHHLRVSHQLIRLILHQVDPVGVESRRSHRLVRRTYVSRGPNHLWHIDGYDKLRPYGFLISGLVIARGVLLLSCVWKVIVVEL